MSKRDKLLARIQDRPKDFTWDEACRLMRQCGYEILTGSGSRRKFWHSEKRHLVSLHQPHPRTTLIDYEIKEILEALKTVGEIENE